MQTLQQIRKACRFCGVCLGENESPWEVVRSFLANVIIIVTLGLCFLLSIFYVKNIYFDDNRDMERMLYAVLQVSMTLSTLAPYIIVACQKNSVLKLIQSFQEAVKKSNKF